jgi:hypothetical protein
MPRNTFIVWKQSVFTEVGMFDESLDEDTGMEDLDLALRIYERRGARNVSLELNRHLDFGEARLGKNAASRRSKSASRPSWSRTFCATSHPKTKKIET